MSGAGCEFVMRSVRFITWNCRSGSLDVRLAQLNKYRPDVVFLQECAPTEQTPCTWRVNARKSIALVGLSPDFELSPLTTSITAGRASVAASFDGRHAFSVIGIWGQLPNYVEHPLLELFKQVSAASVSTFCLDMYGRMGLLDGIRVVSSSDPAVRRAACEVPDFFVELPHEGETVRARFLDGTLKLHEGGDAFVTLPSAPFSKEQISPTRDSRLRWMQSVVHCTHYIAGAGEQAYLRKDEAPEITFVVRDTIERSDEAYTDLSS